jgi:hypothetical protein
MLEVLGEDFGCKLVWILDEKSVTLFGPSNE